MWFFFRQTFLVYSLKKISLPTGFLRTVLTIYCDQCVCFPSLLALLLKANTMQVGSTAENVIVLLQKFFETSMTLSVKDHRLAFFQTVFWSNVEQAKFKGKDKINSDCCYLPGHLTKTCPVLSVLLKCHINFSYFLLLTDLYMFLHENVKTYPQ